MKGRCWKVCPFSWMSFIRNFATEAKGIDEEKERFSEFIMIYRPLKRVNTVNNS
jgi:hypothetical protein